MNIKKIEKRIGIIRSHWNPIYDKMRDDWKVYNLDQWEESQALARKDRPMIVDDFCRPYVKQVVSNTYQNPGFIKLNSRSAKGNLKAKALQESLRYIEDKSDSGDVKSHAIECAAVCGIGFMKLSYDIGNEEENDSTVDIYIDKVVDPLNVYIDDKSVEIDGSDMKDAVVYIDGDSNYIYYHKKNNVVTWYEVKNNVIIEEDIFPAAFVPIIPVYGEMNIIEGDRSCFGILRAMKDIQREHNYIKSDVMERLALTPSSSTIIDQGSMSPEQEKRIRNNSGAPETVIKYKSKNSKTKENYLPPTQSGITPNIGYAANLLASINNSAKTTTGIYTYTEQQNQESGIAIDKKQKSSDSGQLVYSKHLKCSEKQSGIIILQMIETLYEDEYQLPIQNEMGINSLINIGGPEVDVFGNPMPMIDNVKVGDSSISISSQPAYTTRKSEGLDKIFELLPKMAPDLQAKLWPEIIKDLDFPNSKKYYVLTGGVDEDNEVDPRIQMQKIAELTQQLQNQQATLNKLQNTNLSLQTEIETQSRLSLRKQQMSDNTKILIERMKINGKSISDNKDLYGKELENNAEVDIKKLAEMNKKQIADDKIAAQVTKQNKEILAKTITNIKQSTDKLYSPDVL